MLAGTDGLGYMMVWGRTLFQLDIVIVGMIVVGVVGFALDLLLKRAEALMRKGSHV
jgi:sulfonate transport system permease protein